MTAVIPGNWAMAADHTTPSITPDEALSRLKAGNKRFAHSKVSTGQPVATSRAKTAQKQHPFATKIRKKAELGELTSQVRIVEGYYDLDTCKVAVDGRVKDSDRSVHLLSAAPLAACRNISM